MFDKIMKAPESPSLTSEWDLDQLRTLGTLVAAWRVNDVWHPVVEPLRAWDHHMDFDREICAAGVKSFIRPIMESDQPECLMPTLGDDVDYVLVYRIASDMRVRIGLVRRSA